MHNVMDNGIVRPATPEEVKEIEGRAAQDLQQLKERLVGEVDDAIAQIYASWMRFDVEYTSRESAARAYVAAGYEGDAGAWVLAYADAAGISAREAADRIISQADALRAALVELGTLRMQKYLIQSADNAEIAQAQFENIVAQAGLVEAGLS